MQKLIYSMLTSLDGYVADQTGNFDWAAPSAAAMRPCRTTFGSGWI
jgi:hypothetical protein